METQIMLGDITVSVVQKEIRNIHLSVHPPTGRVSISAPLRMDLDTIRIFAISKLSWIRKQQERLRAQERETPREYLDRESHYVWGKRYLLRVMEKDAAPEVALGHTELLLCVRPGTDDDRKQAIIDEWYRGLIRNAVPALLAKWEPTIGVNVEGLFVQQMKTKWGSCSPARKNIRLNTDLAKKPAECLEYVVVHELTHLLEASHNARFVALMDGFMPQWRFYRDKLNGLPVRHEDWAY